MTPQGSSQLCNFHEDRLNSLDEALGEVRACQSGVEAKLEDLSSHVQGLKTEMSGKLDQILEKSETAVHRVFGIEAEIQSVVKAQEVSRLLAMKVIPPIIVAALGIIAGAGGKAIWSMIFGG